MKVGGGWEASRRGGSRAYHGKEGKEGGREGGGPRRAPAGRGLGSGLGCQAAVWPGLQTPPVHRTTSWEEPEAAGGGVCGSAPAPRSFPHGDSKGAFLPRCFFEKRLFISFYLYGGEADVECHVSFRYTARRFGVCVSTSAFPGPPPCGLW